MSSILWQAVVFLAAVGPLILFHELGHYWAGRWRGVRAESFSIGFGQEVAGWTDRRGTRWKIAWLPLGGYVRFAGEYELDGSPSSLQPFDGFETAKLWERALIIAAGPVANFVLAFIVLCGVLIAYGTPLITPQGVTMSNVVRVVEEGSPAARAGLEAGDRIVSIDGTATPEFDSIRNRVIGHANVPIHIDVLRGDHHLIVVATPSLGSTIDRQGHKGVGGHLGLVPDVAYQPVTTLMAPVLAAKIIGNTIAMIGLTIGKIFIGQIPFTEIGGPLQTAHRAAEFASYGAFEFLNLIAFISINLGFMNLLPIPVLDGGHLALYGIEAIRRKPLNAATRERVFRTGLVMVMTLFVVVTFNDLASFGVWKQLAGLIG